MNDRKYVREQLRGNRLFAAWLKTKPELYKELKKNPSMLESMLISWKKEQNKQTQLQKISDGYRQVASQIQELQSLIEQVEGLMSNVKQMNQHWDEYRGRLFPKKTNTNKRRS
ncbi:hypothetical protein BEP19_06510 [Ammoniphilus oxalaticus]|uniref:Uncharacterized protein n=1 Tax=Ammoniphilus oxalaticus TaxID=66863 RepID=A0A419SJD5_9BACL|nr:hypothetical protein [Ammoniphilus oxalaticus]RKD24056.1 hypothetical protein BEP19_06510 [Ammoniphilus oxalaticus]